MGPLPPILAGGRAWPPPPGMLGGGLCSRRGKAPSPESCFKLSLLRDTQRRAHISVSDSHVVLLLHPHEDLHRYKLKAIGNGRALSTCAARGSGPGHAQKEWNGLQGGGGSGCQLARAAIGVNCEPGPHLRGNSLSSTIVGVLPLVAGQSAERDRAFQPPTHEFNALAAGEGRTRQAWFGAVELGQRGSVPLRTRRAGHGTSIHGGETLGIEVKGRPPSQKIVNFEPDSRARGRTARNMVMR